MEIPYSTENRNEPVTILRFSKYPYGTKERQYLENYIIDTCAKLMAFELASNERVNSELN